MPAGATAAAREDSLAIGRGHALHQRLLSRRPRRRVFDQQRTDRVDALAHLPGPALQVGRVDRLGVEGGIAAAPVQGRVQFGRAPREHAHALQEALVHRLDCGLSGPMAAQPELQLIEGQGPGVALVGEVGLQQDQAARGTAVGHMLDRPGHGGVVLEMRHVCEEPTHLRLDVDARAHLAQHLHEQALLDHQRGTARLRQHAQLRRRGRHAPHDVRERCRGQEAQRAAGAAQFAASRHRIQDRRAEGRVGLGIGHHAHARADAHLRHGGGLQKAQALVFAVFPGQRKGANQRTASSAERASSRLSSHSRPS